jgi:hypothetical protein
MEVGMRRYSGWGGKSGIAAYDAGEDWIEIQFKSGDIYRYTANSAGAENIEAMKKLAFEGRGLASFIARTEDMRYASKRHA